MKHYPPHRLRISWLSREAANEIPLDERRGNYLIRINDSPEYFASADGWAGVCDVECADYPSALLRHLRKEGCEAEAEKTEKENRLFSEGDAARIWDFVAQIPYEAILYVHCEAGISRSAAVAAAIAKIHNGDDRFVFDRARPNPHIYGMMIMMAPYSRFMRWQGAPP